MSHQETERPAGETVIVRGSLRLAGDLSVPHEAAGVVIFAHGSGSSRHSPRNQFVAHALQQQGLGTLLFDLLTEAEERVDTYTGHLRFNISLLAERLMAATHWVREQAGAGDLPAVYFGSSTGAAAALVAAATLGARIRAVVSRGGRPDLAGAFLAQVQAPTLLMVGGNDPAVLRLNQQAQASLRCENSLLIIPGATHLFAEPGALEQVAALAAQFVRQHLPL